MKATALRRVRAGGNSPVLYCQVPGCTVDVTGLKDFNLRCRVCLEHSRAQSVDLVDGPHRFCQQCNKFQPVDQFEDGKRGCREKLLVHNLRRQERRKQKSIQKSIRALLYELGNRESCTPDVAKKEVQEKSHEPSPSEDQNTPGPKDSAEEQPVSATKSPCSSSSESYRPLSKRKAGQMSTTAELSGQKIKQSVSDCNSESGSASNGLLDVKLDSTGYTSSVVHELVNVGMDFAFPGNEWQYPSPGSVPVNQGCGAWKDLSGSTGFLSLKAPLPRKEHQVCNLDRFDQELDQLNRALGLDNLPWSTDLAWMNAANQIPGTNVQPGEGSFQAHVCSGPGCFMCGKDSHSIPGVDAGHLLGRYKSSSSGTSQDDSLFALPPWMDCAKVAPMREQHSVRISMKVDNVTPRHMPDDLYSRASTALQVPSDRLDGLTGYIRPGCVHLTVDYTIDDADHAAAVQRDLPRLAKAKLLDSKLAWSKNDIDVDLPGCTIVHRNRKSILQQPSRDVVLEMVQIASCDMRLQMVVRGFENCREPCILVRQDGKYLSNYIEAVQSMVDGTSLVTAILDEAELGVLWVEVAYCAGGVFAMTEAFPSLITDVEGVVHDLHQFACSRIQMTKDADKVVHQPATDNSGLEVAARLAELAASRGCTALLEECTLYMNEVGALEHPMLHKLLVHAVQSSNFETVTHMLSCYLAMGMRPQTGWSDQNGMTILHWAALCGIPSILRVLRLTCPEADHLWESAKGPGPGFLTPADMLTERVKLLNDVQSCRPAQRVPATEIDIRFPITIPVLPFLLLFMAFCLEPQLSEVLAWITLMVLVAYPEYMLRSGIWCIRKRIHKQMSSIAEHHQPGLEVGRIWLVLSDQVVDVAYTNEWSRHVRWYDGFIAYAYVMKLAFMSLRPGAAWLMPLGSPIAAVLISRCFQSQSPRTREITNIVLAVYCWAYYYFASTFQLNDSDDTANYVTHVTCSSVLSSTLCAFFLSVQFSSIFPFRMRRCCLAGMVYFVVVLLGTQWRLLACGGSQVFRQGLLDWLCRSIFHSISPALWAAVGAELPCRLMERQRLGAFLAKYMKQA